MVVSMGWGDASDAGGHGRGVPSLWGESGRAWAEDDRGGLKDLLDCYLHLLSPQGC